MLGMVPTKRIVKVLRVFMLEFSIGRIWHGIFVAASGSQTFTSTMPGISTVMLVAITSVRFQLDGLNTTRGMDCGAMSFKFIRELRLPRMLDSRRSNVGTTDERR